MVARRSMQRFVTDNYPSPQRIVCPKRSSGAFGRAGGWLGYRLGSRRNL